MRPLYVVVGLMAFGLGLAGWATLGQAQDGPKPPALPDPELPMPGRVAPRIENRTPVPKPPGDPFDLPAVPKPVPKPEPVRSIEVPELRAPEIRLPKAPAVEPVKEIGPIAKQDPSVSLEWHGSTIARAGTATEFTLVARNTCAIPLHKVIVQVRVPEGAKVASTEPKADGSDKVLLWELGTLATRDEKRLKMSFVPPAKGEWTCQAWVTVTGSATVKIATKEPKLAIKLSAPEKVMVGDAANVVLAVSNPGDYPAEGVKLAVHLGDGLESARGPMGAIDVGTLAAGESKQITIPCVAKSAGSQKCEVSAAGDGGLQAADRGSVAVIQPRLAIELTGPKLRYLDRKAQYVVTVSNPGDTPATNVSANVVLPTGFKFIAADSAGQLDAGTRTVKWFLGEVGAGQSKELKCEALAVAAGDHSVTANVSGGRVPKAEKTIATKVEGLSALLMEVVDTDDPVEVGADTTYEIRITNTGSKDDTDVKLACLIPPQFKLKAAIGPVKYDIVGNEVVFQSLPKLAARGDVTYKITLTAAVKGDARFKATLTSGGLTEPVVKQESTRVYSD